MKNRTAIFFGPVVTLVLTIMIGLIPLTAQAQTFCGTETETTLLAGQTIPAGSVTVSNDGQDLLVTYHTDGDWLITETHLHVATRPEDLPQTRKGNAIPGRFDYKGAYDDGVTEATHSITLANWPAGTQLYIAAHCVVVSTAGSETAWGNGFDFPGNNWAMYFAYTVQPCEPPSSNSGVIEFAQPSISVAENAVSIILQLVRNDGSDGDVTVTLEYVGLSATEGDDYQPGTTTVTFADGETEKQVEVFILDDEIDENDELFGIYLIDVAGAQLGDQLEMTCTIVDDDDAVMPE